MKKKHTKLLFVVYVVVMAVLCTGMLLFWTGRNKVTNSNKLGVAWYDETGKEFVIKTADELYELAALSDFYTFEGQTIKLGADIVVNEGNAEDWGETPPSKKWYPISGFAGIFDGQGHTISGIYGTGIDTPMALFSNTDKYCEIYDFKLLNSRFETKGTGGTASIFTGGGGSFKRIYSDAIISCTSDYSAGFASRVTRQAILDECWFDGEVYTTSRDSGAMIDFIDSCTVTIKHSLCSGDVHSTYTLAGTRTGGFCGKVGTGAVATQLVLQDSLYSGEMDMARATYSGSAVGVYYAVSTVSAENTYVVDESYEYVMGQSGAQGKLEGAVTNYGKSYLTGFQSYMWTNLDFENYWAVVEDDTPVLKYFTEDAPDLSGVKRVFDTSWYSELEDTFVLNTKEELYGFYMLSAGNDFDGKTIKLGSDIVLNEGKASDFAKEAPYYMWFPIVNFAGEFDGQGHTISGIYMKSSITGSGLFAKTDPLCEISNLKITNSYMVSSATGAANIGSLAGYGAGTFTNIYSDAIVIVENAAQGGGLVGVTNGALEMKNCWFDGSVSHYNDTGLTGNVGGILGLNSHKLEVESCLFSGSVKTTYINLDGTQAAWRAAVGGLIGRSMNTVKMSDCASTGSVYVSFEKNPELDYTGKHVPKNILSVGSVIGYIQSDATLKDNYAVEGIAKTKVPDTDAKVVEGVGEMLATKEISGGVVSMSLDRFTDYNAYRWTTLDFEESWAVVRKDTPILKYFASSVPSLAGIKKQIDTSWYENETYVIKTKAQLYGFAILSGADDFKGKTVSLGADITINTGTVDNWIKNKFANLENWMPIGNFAGTFDGKGHTISGIYLNKSTEIGGLFAKTTKDSKICNLSIKNSYFVSSIDQLTKLGSIVGQGSGTLQNVYSNAQLATTRGMMVGGMVGYSDNVLNVDGCWFDGKINVNYLGTYAANAGGFVGQNVHPVTFSNCLYTGDIDVTYMRPTADARATRFRVGGFTGSCSNTSTVTGSLSAGTIDILWKKNPAVDYSEKGSIAPQSVAATAAMIGLGEKACTISNTYTTTVVVNTVEDAGTTRVSSAVEIPTGVTLTGDAAKLDEKLLSGIAAYQYTMLDFDKYWTAVANELPELKYFTKNGLSVANVEKMIDTSWYQANAGTASNPYVLDSKKDLYGFSILSQSNDFAGKTVVLGANIDLNAGTVAEWKTKSFANLDQWIPIGNFAGTFDGKGYTISGIYLNTDSEIGGLFAKTTKASKICNLSIKNSYYVSSAQQLTQLGSVVGRGSGTLQNVYSDAELVTTVGMMVGGMVGYADNALSMTGCWFAGDVNVNYIGTYAANAGGFVGQNVHPVTFTDCLFTGNVDVTYMRPSADAKGVRFRVGGFTGSASNTATVTGGVSGGTVTVKFKQNPNVDYSVSGSVKPETITGVGTLIGYAENTTTISNTYVTGGVLCQVDEKADTKVTQSAEVPASVTRVGDAAVMSTTLMSGVSAYQYTMLDFNTIWTAVSEDLPALKYFVKNGLDLTNVKKMVDISWYEDGSYVLDSKKDLYGFAILSQSNDFAGKTIKLGANITLNDGTVDSWKTNNFAGLDNWIPIGSFAGTFDGQGHEITGLYLTKDSTYAGLFLETKAGAKLCNFSLKNSYLVSEEKLHASIGSIVGNARGSLENIYSDAEVVTTTAFKAGGFVGANADALTMKGCWYAGDVIVNYTDSDTVNDYNPYAGGFIGQAVKNLTMEDCLFTGNVTANYKRNDAKADALNFFVGAFAGRCHEAVTITDCVSYGTVLAYWNRHEEVNYSASGAKVPTTLSCVATLVGHTAKAATLSNVYDFTVAKTQAEGKAVTTITAAAVGNTNGAAIRLANTFFLGADAYRYMALDFAKEYGWVAVEGKLPELKYFSKNAMDISNVTPMADYDWYSKGDGSVAKPYVLEDSKDLYGFAMLCNSDNFKGKLVKLGDENIKLNSGTVAEWKTNHFAGLNIWIPISNFAGTFDGNGKTISGLYLSQDTNCAGLFGKLTAAATIQNLYLKDSYIACNAAPDARVGSIVGWAQGGTLTLTNVYSNAEVVAGKGMGAGGLVGYCHTNAPLTMTSCWFDGDVIMNDESAYAPYAGGMVGQTATSLTMTDCLFTGDVDVTYEGTLTGTPINAFVGGFVGRCSATAAVTRSLSAGTVSLVWKKNASVNYGTTTAPAINCVAGLFGHVASTFTVSKAYNATTTKVKVWDHAEATITDASIGAAPSEAIASTDKASLLGETLFSSGWSAISGSVPVPTYFKK